MTNRSGPDDQLEARVLVAAKAVRRAFEEGLAELGLNMSEGGALGILSVHGSLTQTELASRLHIGRASSGFVVDGLERRALIERRADPTDRRVWRIELTESGVEFAKRFELRHAEVRAALRRDITTPERRELRRLLDILADNASRYSEELDSSPLPDEPVQPRQVTRRSR